MPDRDAAGEAEERLAVPGRESGVAVCEAGESIRIEYMNRLITPRSQRRIIGTVFPSIVVVCAIDDAGGGEAGLYGRTCPVEVAVDERDDGRRLAGRRLRDRWQAVVRRVARVAQTKTSGAGRRRSGPEAGC